MTRDNKLTVRAKPPQRRQEGLLFGRMKMQLELIDQYDRTSDLLAHKIIEDREHRLLARGHFGDVVLPSSALEEYIRKRVRLRGPGPGPVEFQARKDPVELAL